MKRECIISLAIPVYNCADYIDETLASVLNRIPDSCELILVDDGSDEETGKALTRYEGSRDNLRMIYRPHRGVSAARNAAIEASSGTFVAFMDCDDCLKPSFFESCLPRLSDGTDLYIFGFDRIESNGETSESVLEDREYVSAGAFADAYIRFGHLLVYSACNKVYRKRIIDQYGIRFREGMDFGEDRLFNYDYLSCCGAVTTCKDKMFSYMQRNADSASKRSHPGFFQTIMQLHDAKVNCFLQLADRASEGERIAFAGSDLTGEIARMIGRFQDHPAEKRETLPEINRLIWGSPDRISKKAEDWYLTAPGREAAFDTLKKRIAVYAGPGIMQKQYSHALVYRQ